MIQFSHSILGKLVAVLIILFYSYLDWIIGLFVCSLVIFYYQTKTVESLLNLGDLSDIGDVTDFKHLDSIASDINYETHLDNVEGAYLDLQFKNSSKKNGGKEPFFWRETMVNYNELYGNNDGLISFGDDDLQKQFVKDFCRKNVLMDKGLPVKIDIAEHVYSQLKFKGGTCNPCDSTCDFSIVDSKILTEEKLRPVLHNP
jgi:hypothetical protein